MEIDLTQNEADSLIATEKRKVDDTDWIYPGLGGSIMVPLVSVDGRENFFLDANRSRINLEKGSYQNRVRRSVVLVRLCFGGRPHTNPDGEVIEGDHLHRYKAGFGDKWANPTKQTEFSDLRDLWQMLMEFCDVCNVVELPNIRRDLFS